MNANEIIDCQLREDGLHVTAYRHKGVCVASCVSFGKEHKMNMNIGERKSLDEDALKELAEEKILPWIKQILDPRFNEIEVPIILSICDMSIENELPNRMSNGMKNKYIELLVDALSLFYKNDAEALFTGRLVHEQAMVGCIARYAWCLRRSDPRFSSLLPDVDVEYDKVQEREPKAFDALIDHIESCPEYYSLCGGTICNDKQVDDACNDEKCKYCEWKNKPKRFRPDLIVHKRNEDLNGLVVEFKKGGDGKLEDVRFDMAKLRACTCAQNSFKYEVGAFVSLEAKYAHIKVFIDRKVDSWFKVNNEGRCEYAENEEVPLEDLHELNGSR